MRLKNSKFAKLLYENGSTQIKSHTEEPPEGTESLMLTHISLEETESNYQRTKTSQERQSSIAECRQRNKSMILNDKSNLPEPNTQIMKSSKTSDPVSTGNDEGFSPYWNALCVGKSKKLLSSIGIDLQGLDTTSLSPSASSITHSSGYMTQKQSINLAKMNSRRILCQSLLSSRVDKWGREDTALGSRRSRCTRIYLNQIQQKKFRRWIDDARILYNTTVNQLSGTNDKANTYKLRNDLVIEKNTKVTDPKILDSMKHTPKDIRAKACFEACQAHDLSLKRTTTFNPKYKSYTKALNSDKKRLESIEKKMIKRKQGTSLLQSQKELLEESISLLEDDLRYIPKYISKTSNVKKRLRKNPYGHIFIPKSAFKIDEKGWTVYRKYNLGIIKSKEPIDNISSDFQIRWHRRTNSWHIITSEKVNVQKKSEHHRTVVIDPGINTFLTCLNFNNKIEEYGDNWYEKLIAKRVRKLDRCMEELKGKRGVERFHALNAKKHEHLHRRKIQNIVNELHKKTAKELTDKYDVIVLPKLGVRNMLKKSGGLGNKINRKINILSHGKFHDYLTWRAWTLGKIVINQDEAFTTKTCFKCGKLNNIGGARIYECQYCDNVCGRDIQSCYNILTKYMGSYSPSIE